MSEKNYKLAVQNLSKDFGEKEVIQNISFGIEDGEFVSILGSSGCGKTTILRILIGLIEPTSGQVLLDGKDITKALPSERKMGIVFQNYALFENMSVLQNVEYALKQNKEKKNTARKVATKLLERVGLSDHLNKKPHHLSGGQQQRVAIARTLAMNPEIILFDEPMSALDADTRLTLRQELLDIQKEYGNTMVYITHDQEEAFALSDKIIVMDKGVIQQMDTPENILNKPANEFVKKFVCDNLHLKINSLMTYVKQ